MPPNVLPERITAALLDALPEPAQRYLRFAGVENKTWITAARVSQRGKFRRAANQPWMPVSAEQDFTSDPPGFIWRARFKLFGLPLMSARDSYTGGLGRMFGRIAGLFKLFDGRGAEFDQGSLGRYLAEMMWFPTAFLGTNMRWSPVDSDHADVTITDGAISVTARLGVDSDGRITRLEMRRYRDLGNDKFRIDPWGISQPVFELLGGFQIPVRGMVTWFLPEGDLPYYDYTITAIDYKQ